MRRGGMERDGMERGGWDGERWVEKSEVNLRKKITQNRKTLKIE